MCQPSWLIWKCFKLVQSDVSLYHSAKCIKKNILFIRLYHQAKVKYHVALSNCGITGANQSGDFFQLLWEGAVQKSNQEIKNDQLKCVQDILKFPALKKVKEPWQENLPLPLLYSNKPAGQQYGNWKKKQPKVISTSSAYNFTATLIWVIFYPVLCSTFTIQTLHHCVIHFSLGVGAQYWVLASVDGLCRAWGEKP